MVLGPSPLQQEYLDRLQERIFEAVDHGRGRVVFLAGGVGTGRSYWFDVAAQSLRGTRVLWGGFGAHGYEPRDVGQQPAISGDASDLIKSVAGLGQAFGPMGSLVGQLMSVSVDAYRFVEGLRGKRTEVRVLELLPGLLRIAASDRRSPLVCLVDDADMAEGNWLTTLLLSFAQEIEQELPLVLVMGIEGPDLLPDAPREDETGACQLARSLRRREPPIGEWWGFRALSYEEVSSWVGSASPTLLSDLWQITEGDPGEVAEVWESWSRRKAIAEDDEGRWQIDGPVEKTLAEAGDRFDGQLAGLLGEDGLDLIEDVRKVLACAALEGRTFTAEAVARALEWDPDDLIDLLDDHLCRTDGPLREAGKGVVIFRGGVPIRTVWRYSFSRNLDRRIVQARYSSAREKRSMAQRLAPALIDTYSPEEHRVASALASVCQRAGDLAAAAHFRRIADLGNDHVMLRAQARYLMNARTEGWTRWDLARAADLLLQATHALYGVDPFEAILGFAKASARLAEAAQARLIEVQALSAQADSNVNLGRLEQAHRDLARARDIGGATTPRWLEAQVLYSLGRVEVALGNDAAAREPTERALTISQEIGDRDGEAHSLQQLGRIEIGLGNHAAAREPTKRALTIFQEIGNRDGEAASLHQLQEIERNSG